MPKIKEITINGFKAFPSKFELNLEGKHLLMYGENGSGKSSIYYALHCLFNSIRKPDYGKKYFDINNRQNLINKHFISTGEGDIPHVAVTWLEGVRSPFLSGVSEEGCKPSPQLMELDTCFINHQFLYSFFSFTNSKTINLFPIFQKEILPYLYDYSQNTYVSLMYDTIVNVANTLGNRRSTKNIDYSINYFNNIISSIIDEVNFRASEIYNDRFKSIDDRNLKIKLIYPETDDLFDESNLTGYWLKYDKQQIIQNGEIKRASNKSLNTPLIRLEITEEGDEKPIEKPQTYFNEAKLTAIALSIRFSLINLDSPKEGSFLALDDMLISLDMSNRVKVVDFLLNISDKYKVYLFTHDRAFFEYFKERIYYTNRSKGLVGEYDWLFKELYKDDTPTYNPKVFNSESDIARAHRHYNQFDYPASANYLRKAVETMLDETLPSKMSKTNEGMKNEKLRNILETSFDIFSKIQEFDMTDLTRLISNLNLLLNPLSHKSTETNVYKTELKEIFAIIERLSSQIQELSIKEILARKEKVYLYLEEDDHITQKYEIELQYELYAYRIAGTTKVLQPEAQSIRSLTITDGIEGEYVKNEHYKGSLENICQDVYVRKNKMYANNYLELYKDKNGNQLLNLIQSKWNS